MAIQEYTDELNDITLTATKRAIIITDDNRILDGVCEGTTHIITKNKVVTGTLLQINKYIEDNSLEDYVDPSPIVE
jgi:Fe-S cluster assembly ATPase SufC